MTAGNNGSGVPQDDDPFAYLYRQEGGDGGAGQGTQGSSRTGGYGYPGPQQPGVPRTSYNHVRAVGERQYGGQQQYGQQQQQPAPQQGGYGYPQHNAHYTAPEALPQQTRQRAHGAPPPGGVPPRQAGHGQGAPAGHGGGHGGGAGHGGGGRGPNSKGLLIGAIAVVAVVIIGISVAMISNNSGDKDDKAEPTQNTSPTAAESVEPSQDPKPTKEPEPLPTEDASAMRLDGGTTLASDIPGAKAEGGKYVAGINKPGAGATWSVDVEKAGQYRLYVGYGVPGEDQNLSLTVNSKRDPRSVSMKNFALAKKGDWAKGWTHTWAIVNLNKGTNTVRLSCEAGNKCDVNLDQVWLARG
ncbi:carbohydrate-binding protein [Streptomyces buecherae]|uniref:carbohydrate-binding protein n=1 Tax=Streptomyces buecherae TaxID=2763006 RepID=UPI0033EA40E3